jgi:5-(carboxyamino)imidazole ribonucleotide synthase
MFVDKADTVLVNELAPRPHNSGHLTIEACLTSQFEQQVRAMCNLPLGSMEQRAPAAMANLLGDLWQQQPPAWSRILDQPGLYLHLYGKDKARPGRKMGHLTALDSTAQAAAQQARAARERLLNPTAGMSTERSADAR